MLRKTIVNVFTITLLLFLIRLALPQYLKYLLFPSVALLGILTLTEFILSKRWQQISLKSYRLFIPIVLLLFTYFFAFVQTPYRAETLFKDTFNLLVLTAFIFSALLFDFKTYELSYSLKRFKLLAVIFSSLFALAGIAKLYFMLKGHKWEFLSVEGVGFPQGTSLSVDDNFFTLVCVVGILIASSYLFKELRRWQSALLQLALWVLIVNIMLATSRRGLIIASIFIIVFILTWLTSWFIRRKPLKNFRENSTIFFLSFSLSTLFLVYALFGVSTLKRNEWLASSNFDKKETVVYMNWLTMAGESIFRGQVTFDDVQKENWSTSFDSRYPYAGWANGNYQLVNNLNELGLTGVPADAQGAKVGNWVQPSTRSGNAYYYSKLFEGKVEPGKRYLASVYCYVSPDFNGSWVRMSTSGNLKGIRNWYYNTDQKGTWQKLQTTFYADSGDFKAYIYLCKENDSTFTNLNGHVIYAFPELKEIAPNPANPLTWANTQFELVHNLPGKNRNILPDSVIVMKPQRKDYRFRERDSLWVYGSGLYRYESHEGVRINPSIFVYVSDDFNGDEVALYAGGKIYGFTKHQYDLDRKGTWQQLYLSYTIFEGKSSVDYGFRKKVKSPNDSIKGYVLFAYPEERFLRFDPSNPMTWTGSNFKQVYPLTGKNVEIVPRNSIGLRVDKETQPSRSNNSVYNANVIRKVKFKTNRQRVKTSIYAYVSEDFNGELVRLGESSKKLGGYSASYYDLDRKGTWQKLTINNWGEASVEYYSTTFFLLPNAKDFKKLKGYVVYAHPEFNTFEHDPKNPETYTSSTYQKEFPLVGKNADIVPKGVIGARYDRTTEGKQWRDFHHSTTLFWGVEAESGDSVFASVYCYVSPEFNGQEARLEIRGKVSGATTGKYNFNAKGEWVLLQAKGIVTEKGWVYGAYFFSQKGVTDFSNLTGHITFAYPQLLVRSNKISLIERTGKLNRAGIISGDFLSLNDTIYDNFEISLQDDHFAGPRIDRWRYAIHLYMNEYSFTQKLFGGGFTYTIKFARKFHPDEPQRDYDYPHNPFLSVLLYSGIVGLIVYLWFLGYALYLYYTYRKEYWLFGLIFLVVFFYSFFSSNSPFDPSFFGLMSALPYIIHHTKKSREGLQ